MNQNLAIWNAVEKTDPTFTKSFKGGGGFAGTATNATYLAKRATEQFGPCGTGWGMKVVDTQVYEMGEEKLHVLQCELWYVLNGERGSITCFGQTKMVTKRSSGLFFDEDAPKKSLTDAMTKGLSLLGFSADIHQGLYDDNRYVEAVRIEYREAKTEARAAGEVAPVSVPAGPKRTREDDEKALAKTRALLAEAKAPADSKAMADDHAERNRAMAASENVVPLKTQPETTVAGAVDQHDVVQGHKSKISGFNSAAELKAYMQDPAIKAQMLSFGDDVYQGIRSHGLAHLDALAERAKGKGEAPIKALMDRVKDKVETGRKIAAQ